MLHVTERAKEALHRKKRAHVLNPEMGLRLASSGYGRLGLVASRVKAGDQVVLYQNEPVLLVEAALSELVLVGKTVDCRETDDGSVELVLRGAGRAA
jgi:hypothetical protein